MLEPCLAATASHLPSGDHDAAPRTSSDSASVRAALPSGAVQTSAECLALRTGKQACLPSGEMAAAPTSAPRAALHTSVAPPFARCHRPSDPPREARYQSDESGSKRGAADRAVGSARRLAAWSSTPASAIGADQRSTLGFDTVATSRRGFPGASALAPIE